MTQPRTVVNTLLHEKKRKISGGFYHRLQVDFAYNSNNIEGSRLTHEQTRYIFETHTVDGTAHVNDILEATNHFKCIDYVLDPVNEPITEAYIKHLHRLLKTGLIEDDYDYVIIGDYKKYIDYFLMLIAPDPVEKIKCSSCTFENNMVFTFTSILDDNSIEKCFYKFLTEKGIEYFERLMGVE